MRSLSSPALFTTSLVLSGALEPWESSMEYSEYMADVKKDDPTWVSFQSNPDGNLQRHLSDRFDLWQMRALWDAPGCGPFTLQLNSDDPTDTKRFFVPPDRRWSLSSDSVSLKSLSVDADNDILSYMIPTFFKPVILVSTRIESGSLSGKFLLAIFLSGYGIF
jgi:hypothetical protein